MAYVFSLTVMSLLVTLVCSSGRVKVLDKKINAIRDAMQTEIALLRHDVDRMDRSLTSYEVNLNETKSHILELKERMDSFMTKIDSLNEAFKRGFEEETLGKSTLPSFDVRMNELETDLNSRLTEYGLKEGSKIGKHGYSIYVRPDKAKDYKSATKICSDIGGYLVEVNSEEENAFILQTFYRIIFHVWLGGSDEITEGDWKWAHSGDRIPMRNQKGFQKWDKNQPNNFNSSTHCLVMDRYGEWSDYFCQTTFGFVCEVDLF